MSTKTCTRCQKIKPVEDFPIRSSNGKRYFHSFCKVCKNLYSKEYRDRWSNGSNERFGETYSKARKEQRADPLNRAKFLLQDCRANDRKKSMVNDLDIIFVTTMLELPCSYCNDHVCLKTLDRIDNEFGHLKNNIVTSCIRCNLVRGNMPYEAWLCLCDGMTIAREKGLFKDWNGKFIRKN